MAFKRHKPYDRTKHDGEPVNWRTKAGLLVMEDKLGYKLSVLQGSYNAGGVAASGGTHDGGGAVDLSPWDWENKVHAGRGVGKFDMWHRPTLAGEWSEHIHGIHAADAEASAEAKAQMAQYNAGTNGLADHGPDNFPFHPDRPPVFDFFEWQKAQTLRHRLRQMVRRRNKIDKGIKKTRKKLHQLHHNGGC
jgi:hypothetical protein